MLVEVISPTFLIRTFWLSFVPSGVVSSGMFGISKRNSFMLSKSEFNNSFSFFKSEFILSISSFNELMSDPEALSLPNSSDNFFRED